MNKKRIIKILKEIYPYIIVVVVVVLLRTFIITPAIVDGASMEPNLHDNNFILLNKFNLKLNGIKRFDVVVIDYNGEKLIKRVIGLPGEKIEYKDNTLYIDGFVTSEDFNHASTKDFKLEKIGLLSIPGDSYFVVGDNRGNSIDSRIIGVIDRKDILGKVSFRIFPLTKIGKIK